MKDVALKNLISSHITLRGKCKDSPHVNTKSNTWSQMLWGETLAFQETEEIFQLQEVKRCY